jgi:ergothioneine biosynthesis protein EgtB
MITTQTETLAVEVLRKRFLEIRNKSEAICEPLATEDYVAQPIVDVSPPKWHLAHTTWFFETFLLKNYVTAYQEFNPKFGFLFNSYYQNVGDRVLRHERGNLTRPTVEEVYKFRAYVNEAMMHFFDNADQYPEEWMGIVELGLQHEQQHQELLWTDLKYILGQNPLRPKYAIKSPFKDEKIDVSLSMEFIKIEKGNYEIGYKGDDFCFDNELKRHTVYLEAYEIANRVITNGEFLEFMEAGGYSDFNLWHYEAWWWLQEYKYNCPMYWKKIDGEWMNYPLTGLKKVNANDALKHISYYEAFAFAQWKGMRLPTEFEWEVAHESLDYGLRWEWTESAYLAYPGYKKAPGAIGEYNGKFMVNQKVLRGGSVATSENHLRPTYRNFWHPNLRWQFTGIRLAQ